MTKRWTAFLLSLLLLSCRLPARADIATLDRSLDRWLSAYPQVRFSATLSLEALSPFGKDTLTSLNAALKHASVRADIARAQNDSDTAVQIDLGQSTILSLRETASTGAYSFVTSLLPHRTLTSVKASPLDLLTALQAEAAPVAEPPAVESAKTQTLNASDIREAFTALDAISELDACYKALTDGILPYATEKRANYNIKGIGAGKWSRIARLTTEQSESLLAPLRDVLACGMDTLYREELSQVTFDKGFIVALYRNADQKDICVYLKGNLIYPDGAKRTLVWQWAFKNDGLERKDTLKIEAARTGGSADARTVAATYEQAGRSDAFSIQGKTETTLKRAKVTDKSTVRVNLAGKQDENQGMTCKGNVGRELAQTADGQTAKTSESATVDLLVTPDEAGAVLSGEIIYQTQQEKTVVNKLTLTLAMDAPVLGQEPATGAEADVSPTADPDATVTITAADGQTAPPSSLEEVVADFEEETADNSAADAASYLVGTPPAGLQAYATPAADTTVDLDTAGATRMEALFGEMLQTLAGKLILAMAALPEEDAAFLRDGMSDQDYAAFLALLDAR